MHLTTELTRNNEPEWLPMSAWTGQLANEWAGRSDIVAYVDSSASVDSGVAALFDPIRAEVEVNTKIAFGPLATPDMVGDIRKRRTQFSYPIATGAIFHEAMHARFTKWDLQKALDTLSLNEYKALHLLEEGRIERLGADAFPHFRNFLRASAIGIAIGDVQAENFEGSTIRFLAQSMGLILARVDAGVLDEADASTYREALIEALSEDVIQEFREVWLQFQLLSAYETEQAYELARQWEALILKHKQEGDEDEDGSGEGEGGSGSRYDEIVQGIIDAMKEDEGNTAIAVSDELDDQQTTEEYKEQVEARSASAKNEAKDKTNADKTFSTTGPGAGSKTSSRLLEKRAPNSGERTAAVKLGGLLDKAKYRDRVEIRGTAVTPPGRLRTRALIQNRAMKENGVHATVEPWRRTIRKHTDDPTLKVGVMVDISGSMGSAMQPMASTAWVLSEAVRRIQGRAAMVYYGESVFATLKPGQHLSEVAVYTAPDGTEKFDSAASALNGAMNLTGGSGARLMVVVSDGIYTDRETPKAKEWVKRMTENGVGVVWLTENGADKYGYYGTGAHHICKGTSAELVVVDGLDVTKATDLIGQAAIRALSRVNQP
jgi:hypothetical protein